MSPPSSPPMPIMPVFKAQEPVFAKDPIGKPPKAKSMQPTFLGTGSVPSLAQLGTKTLLGQ